MATFILVHGGAHGGWCWEHLVPELEKRGHRALAPDLPGMADSPLPTAAATIPNWAKFVAELARAQGEKVVLVGHSRGGPVIGEAAELAPELYLGLVYLTALLLPAGKATVDAFDDPQPRLMEGASQTADGAAVVFNGESARAAFYHRTPKALSDAAIARLCPDPIAPNIAPMTVTEGRWGSLPRAFIECTDDQVMPLSLQRQQQAALPCNPVITLDSDHSPFLWMPEAVADGLDQIVRDFIARST
ncbi:alpha/beta fold hydrolase [Sphingomonas sp.]|uniref:alpha/beta fold hydrolase n=1 Tax=Sphingomonas sp. TaxID=28214 RepID=UPI003B007E6D